MIPARGGSGDRGKPSMLSSGRSNLHETATVACNGHGSGLYFGLPVYLRNDEHRDLQISQCPGGGASSGAGLHQAALVSNHRNVSGPKLHDLAVTEIYDQRLVNQTIVRIDVRTTRRYQACQQRGPIAEVLPSNYSAARLLQFNQFSVRGEIGT